jgi:hypothetical protein
VCLAWGRQSGQRAGIAGDDVSYDNAVLSQGCAKPYTLRLAGLIPYVLQPLYGRSASASPQVSGEVLADIRDQANALVVVAGRIAIVVTSAHVPPQVCHRANLHERVLDEQQARVCRGVLAMSFASHLLIFRQSVRLGSDG